MNYPFWEVAFGSGLLVAIVSIVHVFVSHFAVGGGLFLVLTERRARRTGDTGLLDWIRGHSKFFVLLTVVFGAVSGVGIWFTIGLANPQATATLIRTFLWGWAMEWVFFFLEITAALLYLYGWDRLNAKTHLWFGWIYFITAYMSLVIINGIVTFMLTPGEWLKTGGFWDGFFNPTYWPSLLFRTLVAFALAGIYALVTGSRVRDRELRGRVIRWAGRWILPSLALLPLAGYLYLEALPEAVRAVADGRMPSADHFGRVLLAASACALALTMVTQIIAKRTPLILSLLVLASAFVALGAFEFVREAIRKPYVIHGYQYANGLYAPSSPLWTNETPSPGFGALSITAAERDGYLPSARWALHRSIEGVDPIAAGRELFRFQCMACHTREGYRGLVPRLREKGRTETGLKGMLSSLEKMFGGVMPPFAGTKEEKAALAAYLASLTPPGTPGDGGGETGTAETESTGADAASNGSASSDETVKVPPLPDGEAIFGRSCEDCHDKDPEGELFVFFRDMTVPKIGEILADLTALDEDMPPFEGTDTEREALARFIEAFLKDSD